MDKVLIVVPPLTNPESDGLVEAGLSDFETRRLVSPIEPLTVAADLRARGFTVDFIDLGAIDGNRFQALADKAVNFAPNSVVIVQSILTFATATDWDGARAFETVFQHQPGVTRILTGNHATNYPGEAVDRGVCDYSIRGEAELSVGKLLATLRDHGDLFLITGLSFRDAKNNLVADQTYPSVDVAALPSPDYSIIDAEHKRAYETVSEKGKIRFPEKNRAYRDIMMSRGCEIRCSFCSVASLRGPRQKYRRKTIDQVVMEIKQALDQGIGEIHFFDDLFASSEQQIMEFTEALARENLKFPWFVAQGIPIWPLTRDALAAMQETGMYRVILPLESGQDRVLREVCGKIHSTIEHHHNVTVWSHEMGLEIVGMFVVGMHGETRREILQTVQFAEQHPEIDYSVFSIATPLVGTRLMRNIMREKKMTDPGSVNRIIKRTVGLFDSHEFKSYEMGVIRTFDWDRINFSQPERRAKYAAMTGITLDELEATREYSRKVFHKYFPDYDGPRSFADLVDQPNLFADLEPLIPELVYS